MGTALLGSGCSLLSDDRGLVVDRSKEYTTVEEHGPLKVPDGLEPAAESAAFALPEIINTNGAIFPDRAPRPQPIYADDRNKGVKIQKLGDRRWLVIGERPAIVWPKVKQFLAENGVATTFEAAVLGRVRTQWLEVGDEQRFRDVIRLSIQQGKQAAAPRLAPQPAAADTSDPVASSELDDADQTSAAAGSDVAVGPAPAGPQPPPEPEVPIEIDSGALANALGVGIGALDPTNVLGQLSDPGIGDSAEGVGLGVGPLPEVGDDSEPTEPEIVAFVGDRERIIFSIEQGMRDDNTEVHIRHQIEDGDFVNDLEGEAFATTGSAVKEVEENLLRELGGYLAAEVSSQSVSKVGETIIGSTKASLDTAGDGQPILRLSLDFDRAWASISQALENAEVPITERDRENRTFFVDLPERALTGEENSGFFKRLLGAGNGSIVPLQIQLRPIADGGYQVRALDTDAQPADVELARDVLNLLREFAI